MYRIKKVWKNIVDFIKSIGYDIERVTPKYYYNEYDNEYGNKYIDKLYLEKQQIDDDLF